MTKNEIVDALEEVGLFQRGDAYGEYVRFPCPFRRWNHTRDSARRSGNSYWINVETLEGSCFSCGDRSSLFTLLLFRGLLDKNEHMLRVAHRCLPIEDPLREAEADFKEGAKKYELRDRPKDVYALQVLTERYDAMVEYPERLHEFVVGRGHSLEALRWMYGVRFDLSENRLIQPLWDMRTGAVSGLVGRALHADARKTKDYFGTRAASTFTCQGREEFRGARRYILVEGQFDVYAVWLQLFALDLSGEVVVLGLNKSKLSEGQAVLLEEQFKPVLLMLDGDKAGKEGSYKASMRLEGRVPSIRSIWLPEEDEKYKVVEKGHDPDNLKSEVLREMLRKELCHGLDR